MAGRHRPGQAVHRIPHRPGRRTVPGSVGTRCPRDIAPRSHGRPCPTVPRGPADLDPSMDGPDLLGARRPRTLGDGPSRCRARLPLVQVPMKAADLTKAALWLTSDKAPGDEWAIWFDWHRDEANPEKTAEAI